MTPEEIPDELMAILDRHAGKTHSRTGSTTPRSPRSSPGTPNSSARPAEQAP